MVSCPACGAENVEDAPYCARCGEPLKEGVPRIIYRRRREEEDEKQEKDEFEEKTDTASRNWVALFGLLIVGVIYLLDSWYHVWWASWDLLWPLRVIAFGLFILWNVLKPRERSQRPY